MTTESGRGRKRPPRSARTSKPSPKPAVKQDGAANVTRARPKPGPAKPKRASAPARPAEVREAVLAQIRRTPGITDEGLGRKLKLTKARVGAIARALEKAGLIERRRDEKGGIANHPIATPEDMARSRRARGREPAPPGVSDEDVRSAVAAWLGSRGFEVWTPSGTTDLLAHRGGSTLAIGTHGGGKQTATPRNAVSRSLGRLRDRLGRGHAMYGLAFPDIPVFRTAFVKLAPGLRTEMRLHAFFVRRRGNAWDVTALDPAGASTDLG